MTVSIIPREYGGHWLLLVQPMSPSFFGLILAEVMPESNDVHLYFSIQNSISEVWNWTVQNAAAGLLIRTIQRKPIFSLGAVLGMAGGSFSSTIQNAISVRKIDRFAREASRNLPNQFVLQIKQEIHWCCSCFLLFQEIDSQWYFYFSGVVTGDCGNLPIPVLCPNPDQASL